MEEKKKRFGVLSPRQRRYALASVIVLLSLLGFSAAFVARVYLMTESACYEDLAVETEDAISDLESNLRSDRTMLRVMADLIGNAEDIDSIEVSGYLTNYDYNNLITQIGMLLPGDEIISSKGRRINVDGALSFDTESVQGEHISSSINSETGTNSSLIRSYVPIRKDGICVGLLFSAANPSSIAKAWLPNIYNKKGYCYVVDRRTGEVIISSSPDQIKEIGDISFKQTNSEYSKEVTVNNIMGGKKGYSVFSSQETSEKLYMCYLPFSIEDWEMVVIVPESAAFSDVDPIRNGMYMLIAVSVLCVGIYAAWLMREIHTSIAETEQKANIDVLTGLPNRNRYEAYLKKIDTSKRIVCLYIDANGLHEINNSKGHFAGDQMLRFIADTLKVEFGDEHIYRIGGDEFVVLRYGKTEDEVRNCIAGFNEALQRNDYHAAVGACFSRPEMTVEELIRNAEKDMYRAKHEYYANTGKEMRV